MTHSHGTFQQNPTTKTVTLCEETQRLFGCAQSLEISLFCDLFTDPGRMELLALLHQTIHPTKLLDSKLNLQLKSALTPIAVHITGSCFQAHYIYHYTAIVSTVPTVSDDLHLLNTIINSMPDPIFVKNEQHRWILLNQAMSDLMGVDCLNFLGKSDYDFFPKEEADHFSRKDNEVFLSDAPIETVESLTDASQVTHTVLTKKCSTRLPNGKKILIGVIRDISKIKCHEDEMLEKQAALEAESLLKNRFMTIISHELRTPLNGVLGMARLLSETKVDSHQQKLVDIIASSGKSLLTIISEIIDYSNITAGKIELVEESIDVRKIATACVQNLSSRYKRQNTPVEIKANPKLPTFILIDGNRFSQVLTQLLDNAFKFAGDSSIVITLDINENPLAPSLIVNVADKGPGIHQQDLERIFNHFYQGDNSSTRHQGGSGLGLSLSKQLMQAMGGNLEVTSQIGQGCDFKMSLPLKIPTREAPSGQSNSDQICDKTQSLYRLCADGAIIAEVIPHKSSNNANKNLGIECPLDILVAEDNPINQQVLLGMLKLLGYAQVTLAEDGFSAVELCQKNHFDLILMDVNMPRLDGIEAARMIRKTQQDSLTFIAAITSNTGIEESRRCLQVGMQAHLPKPYNLGSLEKLLITCFKEKTNRLTKQA